VTDEVIKAYIESQAHEQEDGFRIEGEEPPRAEAPFVLSPLSAGPW